MSETVNDEMAVEEGRERKEEGTDDEILSGQGREGGGMDARGEGDDDLEMAVSLPKIYDLIHTKIRLEFAEGSGSRVGDKDAGSSPGR